MSNYIRAKIKGGTYFFTLITFNRRPLFNEELARICLRSSFKETREKYPFKIDAICLLPDHLHCIWTLPKHDENFSIRWSMIKGRFSIQYLKKGGIDGKRNKSRSKKGEAALWQRRFWEHCIRDNEDMNKHIDYIHYNPVKHRYVKKPFDWEWTSFHKYLKINKYSPEWGTNEPKTIQNFNCLGE